MDERKRSNTRFPLEGADLCGALSKAWYGGWLDEFDENHFLIKAIEGRLERFQGFNQFLTNDVALYQINKENFQENFCINFSCKLKSLIDFFGEGNIKSFVVNQLSAGKENYDEAQFFRALSEVSILCFWRKRSTSGKYEPKINGKKNPEARFFCNNGVTVDIEVKTPGFKDFEGIQEIVLPFVLLNDIGRETFNSFCKSHNLNGMMPRVDKLKDFLNSAADKFEFVDHTSHMNFLYINWTFSEAMESGYEEALSLLFHPVNGIINHKDIGINMNVNKDVYEKITAIIVYTESLSGLMFGDFRWVWTHGPEGMPHFGIVGIHNPDALFETTGMKPSAKQLTPILLFLTEETKKEKYFDKVLRIIGDNLLLS